MSFQSKALKFSRKRQDGHYFIPFSDTFIIAELTRRQAIREQKGPHERRLRLSALPERSDIHQMRKSFRANKQTLIVSFEAMKKRNDQQQRAGESDLGRLSR
jgi:hypothetical protein